MPEESWAGPYKSGIENSEGPGNLIGTAPVC